MNIGLFGGTFDPIHRGHLALAAAAQDKFDLGRILFVPTNLPPHRRQPNASYFHRYAMVALATSGEKTLAPSLPEPIRPAANVTKPFAKSAAAGDLVLPGVTVRMLEGVNVPVSSTAVRQAVAAKKPVAKLVGEAVSEYIKKTNLYSGK